MLQRKSVRLDFLISANRILMKASENIAGYSAEEKD